MQDMGNREKQENGENSIRPLYQETIDAIDSLIHMVDPDLKITLVNKMFYQWADRLKLNIEQSVGQNLFKVFPFLAQKVRQEYQKVFKSGEPLITQETTEIKGEKIFTETKKIPIVENNRVTAVVTVVTDITSRKKYEEELKSREEKFRFLFDQSNDAIFLLAPDGTIIDCNPKSSELLEFSKEEIIGKSYLEFVVNKYHDDSKQRLTLLKHGLKPLHYEKEFRGKNGKIIPVEINPTPVLDQKNRLKWIQSVVRDVSDRKRAELLQSILYDISEKTFVSKDLNQLYKAIHLILGQLMNVENFYIAIFDPHTELLSFPYFIDKYDQAPEPKKLGKGLTEYVLRTESPLLLTQELSHKLEQTREVEVIGTECISWLGIPLKTSGDETFGVLVVQSYHENVYYTAQDRDVLMFVSRQIATAIERKKTEEKLRETEIQFHHLQKIESIGTLVSAIAHDYNNILTSVLGNAQLIAYNLPQHDIILNKYVNAIIKASESAAGLVQQLLSFTREEDQHFEVIDLNKIIGDWTELLAQIVGDLIRIEYHLDPDINPIRGIPEKIRQVIMNLVINARDAMPNGGKIRVETRKLYVKKNRYIQNNFLKSGSYTQLDIKDTGIGIDNNIINDIFKPFFSTKSQGKGTGLGLSIVNRIIQEMNACIEIFSQVNRGTTVSIFFPGHQIFTEIRAVKEQNQIYRGIGETILLVEDDDEVRIMLKNLLENHLGYVTLTASNGKKALEILKKQNVAAIVTDLKMPDMDGITLLTTVQKRFPHLANKIIGITAFSDSQDFQLTNLGFRDIIKKPIKINQFSEAIHHILNFRA